MFEKPSKKKPKEFSKSKPLLKNTIMGLASLVAAGCSAQAESESTTETIKTKPKVGELDNNEKSEKEIEESEKNKVNIEFKNNFLVVLEFHGNKLKLYKRKGEKMAYQILKKNRDRSKPVPVSVIKFENKATFLNKISRVLTVIFGEDRPNMSAEMLEVFNKFYNEQTVSEEKTKNLEILDDNTVKIKNIFQGKGFKLSKNIDAKGVEISSGERSRILYFKDKNDFIKKVADWVNENIATRGQGRRDLSDELEKTYLEIKLSQNTGEKSLERNQENKEINDLFSLPYGSYELDLNPKNPPATYLLVKNRNTGDLYCLSFVQAAFDLIHGSGAARKIGLYSAQFAADLNFDNEIDYNSFFAGNLPKGVIVRFNGLGHIGISLGGDKIAHIIGDTFYIDHANNIKDSGYKLSKIIIPDSKRFDNNEQEKKELKSNSQLGKFSENRNIENIAYRVKEHLSSSKDKDLEDSYNYIREAIFQLNKEKFKTSHGSDGQDTRLLLNKDYKSITIPSEWVS